MSYLLPSEPREQAAARLQLIQRRGAMAAEVAELILRLAEPCPDDDDPPPDHPALGAPATAATAACRRRTTPF